MHLNNNKTPVNFSIYPYQNNPPNFNSKQQQKPSLHRKKSSWSSNNIHQSNQYISGQQQLISPMNYKLTNPVSLSLINQSFSNIQQDNQNQVYQPTYSTLSQQIFQIAGSNKQNINSSNYQNNNIHNDFYKYLMEENNQKPKQMTEIKGNSHHNSNKWNSKNNGKLEQKSTSIMKSYTNRTSSASNSLVNQQPDFMLKCWSSQQPSFCSAQQSLHQIQQSQQQLSFLKFKLQQAYQKLQKQILNSYELEQKLQNYKLQVQSKQELLELQKKQNQKLKFTLKAIMKNKSVLEEEMEKEEKKKVQKEKMSEDNRQEELKQNLKLKIEIKELKQTKIRLQTQIDELTKENSKIKGQLQQATSKLQKFRSQMSKKDQYLQNLLQQLQNLQQFKQENKSLLVRQTQYLNKINVLENQLRKVTDEKITTVNRLKHQIALIQQQNGQLIRQNQQIGSNSQVYMMPMPVQGYSPYSNSVTKQMGSKSLSKYSALKSQNNILNNFTPKTPVILYTEVQQNRQVGQFEHNSANQEDFNQFALNSLQGSNIQIVGKPKQKIVNLSVNNQNISPNIIAQNLQKSFVKNNGIQELNKSVGKWKRAQSISNNSSTCFQSISTLNQQNSLRNCSNNYQDENKLINMIQIKKNTQKAGDKRTQPVLKMISSIQQKIQQNSQTQRQRTMSSTQPQNKSIKKPSQTLITTPVNSISPIKQTQDSQDQKLTKYQQHRKNIENQLSKLQKIKRPTKQQRQKIQKLQKQLYYLDSDIAGLKRKIRRKY